MLIKLFKTSQPLALFILPVISLLISLVSFFHHDFLVVQSGMPLFVLSTKLLTVNKIVAALSCFILITLQAYHFNHILQKHEVLYKNSLLPLLLYIFVCALIPQFWSFHPLLFVNSVLILILDKVFSLYKSDEPLSKSFDSCFLIAIASLFYLPAVILILFFAAALLLLRPFSYREWLAGLMGFLVPYLLVGVYFFFTDQLSSMLGYFNLDYWKNSFDLRNIDIKGFSVSVGFTFFLFFLSVVKLRANFFKNVTRTRRYQQTIFILLFVSLLSILLSHEPMVYRFFILSIPLTFFFSYYFLSVKRNWITEVLFWLFVLVIANNFIR